MKIICIVGMPGSGKTFAADVIEKNFGAKAFHSGNLIREEIRRRGLKMTPDNDTRIAHWFHTKGREKLIATRTWDRVKDSGKEMIVLDGFRSCSQIRALEKISGQKVLIIAINTDFKTRHIREIKRRRFESGETEKYLMRRDRVELSHGVGRLIKKADYSIDNSKMTKKQFENAIVALVKQIDKHLNTQK